MSQSSTSWLPSPLNRLYLRRVVEGMLSSSFELNSSSTLLPPVVTSSSGPNGSDQFGPG